jgi:hypothetical protein
MAGDTIYLLLLEGTLLSPLMARNALKSNVTWASYPFLPPTGASGCLAELVTGGRWHEGNTLDLEPRRLEEVPDCRGAYALGAYPSQWQISRRHFRSHLGSIFNYEGSVWSAGQNEGKKLAVVEEVLADELTFAVCSPQREPLLGLHGAARGRVTRVAKKGSLQFSFSAEPDIVELRGRKATGGERALTMTLVEEMGSLPQRRLSPGQMLLYYTPMRSRSRDGRVEWDVLPCIWEENIRLRPGVAIFAGDYQGNAVGLSSRIWDRVRAPWR